MARCLVAFSVAISAGIAAPAPRGNTPAASVRPNIVFIVADDLGYNDLGSSNGGRTYTPNIDALRASGIDLTTYYADRVCAPSRASILTGRYGWGAGFYDMNWDAEHTTKNFTLWPAALQGAGYDTYAIGKWDLGMMDNASTPTYRGFSRFFGFYLAQQNSYWYHNAGFLDNGCNNAVAAAGKGVQALVDLSDSAGPVISPASPALNGSYSADLFSARAAQWIGASAAAGRPFALYYAPMNVHAILTPAGPAAVQAPAELVKEHYARTPLDTYKVTGGSISALDASVGAVVAALKAAGVYDNTAIVFVSDNGGPHQMGNTNAPLRGGKFALFEGGVRVVGFVSGGLLPPASRGTAWSGIMHASDWYLTMLAAARVGIPPTRPGARPLDGLNLWTKMLAGAPSPRSDVVLAVNNSYYPAGPSAIRSGPWKLIRGYAGDGRTIAWPAPAPSPVPLGASGALGEAGTDHVTAPLLPQPGNVGISCVPWCLFNLVSDPGEQNSLSSSTAVAATLIAKLDAAGATGPPPALLFGGNTTVPTTGFRTAAYAICSRALTTPSLTIEPLPA